jgi:hypothetical protein
MTTKPPITEAQRAQVLALAGTTSSREIARQVGVSKTSVLRVLADAPDDAPEPTDAPDVADEVIPEVVPAGTPIETVRRWMAKVERWAQQAEGIGNLQVLASLTARQATLIEAERRATPPPVEDPNTHPDMVREAEAARAKVFGELEQFLAGAQ